MKTLSKILIYFVATCLLAWLLPWTYNFITVRPINSPFTLYSCITKGFTTIETKKDGPTLYEDFNGNRYTTAQFDSINPFFYYRQLLAKDNLPDSINGVSVNAGIIRKSNFNIKQSPRDINVNMPRLWMFMESIPSHVDLDEPKEVIRINNKITIIEMSTNKINEEKSKIFNKVMTDKGFKFPAIALNGNPTTKKEYDEGYLIIDSNNKVFHIKQMKGRPYVRKITLRDDIKANSVLITEFSDKKHLGFVGDEDNNFYVIDRNYDIHQLPFNYNPKNNSIMIIGNMLDWTVKVTDNDGYSIFAIDANNYSLIDKVGISYDKENNYEKASKVIFPFKLSFTSPTNKLIKPSVEEISYISILFNILLGAIYIILNRRNNKSKYLKSVFILLGGIFIFIPLLIIKH